MTLTIGFSAFAPGFFCLILQAETQTPETTPELKRYYFKEELFSIEFPPDWEIKPERRSAYSPKENDKDVFREYVDVDINHLVALMEAENDVEKFFNRTVARSFKHYDRFQELERGKTKVAYQDAIWVIFSYQPTSVHQYKKLVYTFLKGERGYIVYCESTPEQFDEYKNQFEKIVQSFRFE